MSTNAEDPTNDSADRVRRASSMRQNKKIDRAMAENILRYQNSSSETIQQRIRELDEEWDIERILEVNAASLALTGLVLGLTVNRKWLALPGLVLTFLFQHGVQGWCPPLPLLRRLGVRTRSEIDREKYALLEILDEPENSVRH
jgi:hypothetical protein